jgi:hypothetical protein
VQGLAAEHGTSHARVVLERPRFNPTNGMFSAYSTGYSYGVWHGVLACHGFLVRAHAPVAAAHARPHHVFGKH